MFLVGIFIESTNEPVCLIQGHAGGLTHLIFSPDGNRLYSGSRKDSDIHCWDMRNPGKVLQTFKRNSCTNQRIYFDFTSDFKYLCSGDTNGTVSVWDTQNCLDEIEEEQHVSHSFIAHQDCVNGVSFHPSMNLLATSSGQRKIKSNPNDFSLSDDDNDDDEINSKKDTESSQRENALKVWKYYL